MLGFLVASLLPAAYLAVAFPISGQRDLQSLLGSFVVFYFFVAAATAILGIPAFLVLNKLKLVTWWSTIGCGAFLAPLALFVVTFPGFPGVGILSTYAMLGGAAGCMFWIFWQAGRT